MSVPEKLLIYPLPEFVTEVDGWEYWTARDGDATEHFAYRDGDLRTLDVSSRRVQMDPFMFGLMVELGFPSRGAFATGPMNDGLAYNLGPLDFTKVLALWAWKQRGHEYPHGAGISSNHNTACPEPTLDEELADFWNEIVSDGSVYGWFFVFVPIAALTLFGIFLGWKFLEVLLQ